MQRYLRRIEPPHEIFVWTELIAAKKGFDEIWAADVDEAKTAPGAPKLQDVVPASLPLLTKRTLAAFAAFRLDIECEPIKETQKSLVTKICSALNWQVPELPEIETPNPKAKKREEQEVASAVRSILAGEAKDGNEAAALMVDGGFKTNDVDALAQRIDALVAEQGSTVKTARSADAQGESDVSVGPVQSSSVAA